MFQQRHYDYARLGVVIHTVKEGLWLDVCHHGLHVTVMVFNTFGYLVKATFSLYDLITWSIAPFPSCINYVPFDTICRSHCQNDFHLYFRSVCVLTLWKPFPIFVALPVCIGSCCMNVNSRVWKEEFGCFTILDINDGSRVRPREILNASVDWAPKWFKSFHL